MPTDNGRKESVIRWQINHEVPGGLHFIGCGFTI